MTMKLASILTIMSLKCRMVTKMSMMAQSTTPVPILQAKKDMISFTISCVPVAAVKDHTAVGHVGKENRQCPGQDRAHHDAGPQQVDADPIGDNVDDCREHAENKI